MARGRLPGLLWYLRSERARGSATDPAAPARLHLVRADGTPVAESVTLRFLDSNGDCVHECRRPATADGMVEVVLPVGATAVLIDWTDS